MPRRIRWKPSSPVTAALVRADYQDQIAECQIAELMALAAFSSGTADHHDLHRLECLTRIARALNPSIADLCDKVSATIKTDNPDLAHVRELLRKHDADRAGATPERYARAISDAGED